MAVILDLTTITFLIAILISTNFNMLEYLGGSSAFITLYALLYYLSHSFKKLRLEISIIGSLILILIGFNYLSFIEKSKEYPFSYAFVGFALTTILLLIFYFTLSIGCLKRVELKEISIDQKALEIRKRIIERILFVPLLSIVFVISSGFVFFLNPNALIIVKKSITYINLAIFWLIVFFGISFLDLRMIDKNYYAYVLKENERYTAGFINKYFKVFLIILFLGTALEFGRGDWFLWIGTVMFFFLIFACWWTIWKYRFLSSNVDKEPNLKNLKSLSTSSDYCFKYLGAFIAFGSIYFIALAIIFSK